MVKKIVIWGAASLLCIYVLAVFVNLLVIWFK